MTCKWFGVCPLRRLEKEGRIEDKWKREYCLSVRNWKNCARFKTEEKEESHPDNLMPDGSYIGNLN